MIATVASKPKRAKGKMAGVPMRPAAATTLRLQLTDGFEAVRLLPSPRLTPDQLSNFCQENADLRIEQTSEGELIVMLPLHTDNGFREARLFLAFAAWAEKDQDGQIFHSNAGWTLPNGAMRSPDVSWVRQEQLDTLTPDQWQSFAPLCPDFVVELRSRTDRLPVLQEKMAEYSANGARLGWLIDPLEKQVFIYRSNQEAEHLQNPAALSGELVLKGFTLDLARVW